MKILKKVQAVEVTHSKDEYETLEVIIKPFALDLYSIANQNKVKIEEK